jgi:hypothetical protein
MNKVEKMVKKTVLLIAFSWLLLMVFTVVSANTENISDHTLTSKNMVYYPQGKLCFCTHCYHYHQFIMSFKI